MKMVFVIFFFFLTDAFANYSCHFTYDQLEIPHTTVPNENSLYYCLGVAHGKDRAWEMDYFRRVAQGRNAEIFGFSQLKSDLMMRLLDLPGLATRIWEQLHPEMRKLLTSYAAGVNKGFETGKGAKEFSDKDYGPEIWKPEDSLAVLLLQSFDQTRKTFLRDYDEEVLKEKFGAEAGAIFDEDQMPWQNTILKSGEYKPKSSSEKKTTLIGVPLPRLWAPFPDVFGKESGSNNWVVSKEKSLSGNALLANDPHLDLKTPMFWYWIAFKTSDRSLIGATVPGVPVIASGTNGKVAWGLTNSYLNSADAVIVTDLTAEDTESLYPLVWVKFWFLKLPFFFKGFEKLKTGQPVLPLELESDEKIVLRWTGFSLKPLEVAPMFEMNKVNSADELQEILKRIGVPSWNFVFADIEGNIGYQLVGKTYELTEKNPFGMQRLQLKEFLDEKFLSEEDRPALTNPSRNYIYSANNRHWPSDALFYGGRGYSYSFRGFRIDQLLKGKHDRESFQRIQCDRQIVDARFFLPKLKRYLPLKELESWSMLGDENSRQLPIYRRFMDLIMGKWSLNEYALYRILSDLPEEKVKQLRLLYEEALSDVSGRNWGEFLRIPFLHLSKNTDWNFSPEIAGFGDTHTVDPGTARWNPDLKRYEQVSGASMRMVIELTPKAPELWLVLPGPNRNYDQKLTSSPWEDWKNCQYTKVSL